MISITVSNNTKRVDIIINGTATVREAFDKANLDPTKGLVSIDGERVRNLDATLESVGAQDGSVLMSVIKNDNAR